MSVFLLLLTHLLLTIVLVSATTSSSSTYDDALAMALCRARCMTASGENSSSIPRLDPQSLSLTLPSSCTSAECVDCEQCMLNKSSGNSACASTFGLQSFCTTAGGVSATSGGLKNVQDVLILSDFQSPTPVFHCSMKQKDGTFNAAFRFEYTGMNHTQVLANFKSWAPNAVPRVFVITQELGDGPASITEHIITEKWLHTVPRVQDGTRLTVSITAVSANTIYKPSPPVTVRLSDSPNRAAGYPKNVRVVDIRLVNASSSSTTPSSAAAMHPGDDYEEMDYHHDDHEQRGPDDEILNQMDLEVVLHWESGSGPDATCFYGAYCLHEEMTKMESKTPEQAFWAVLDKKLMMTHAKFGAKFNVEVVERPEVGREENITSITVEIPTCLEFLGGDLLKCAPAPVPNLRGHLTPDGFLTLDWDSPVHTTSIENEIKIKSNNSHIQMYKIAIHRLPHIFPFIPTEYRIWGNMTHFEMQLNFSASSSMAFMGGTGTGTGPAKIDRIESILVAVQARSPGGTSPPSSLTIRATTPAQASSIVEKLGATIGFIFALILLVIGLFVVKNFFQKLQRKKSNREYFETLSLNGGEIPRVDGMNGDNGYDPNGFIIQDTKLTILRGYELTKWEIPSHRIRVGPVIGSGAFGIVRKGELNDRGTRRPVAVKTSKDLNGISAETETKNLWEEFEILKGLGKHVHIVGLIGILASKPYEPPSLVVEYCQGGDLQSHLRKNCIYRPDGDDGSDSEAEEPVIAVDELEKSSSSSSSMVLVTNETYFMEPEHQEQKTIYTLSDLDLISYARQIACGMEFLSTNKVVHRDLAARNVLVSVERPATGPLTGLSKRTLKISDFGLSRDVYEQNWYKRNSKGLIPVKWLALECLLQEVYTSKSDVWSFGILLWEIVTIGGGPYPGIDNVDMYEMLKQGYRMPQPASCPSALYDLMRSCWDENPSKRPDFSKLKAELDRMMESSTVLNYLYVDAATAGEKDEESETKAAEKGDDRDCTDTGA